MSSSLKIEVRHFDRSPLLAGSSRSEVTLREQIVSCVFFISVFLIATASCYDALLVYQYRTVIHEQNPICEWLISLEPEHVSIFLLGKGLGTLTVVAVLIGLFKRWREVAIPVAVSLVVFQAGLMTYLHGSEVHPYKTQKFASITSLFFPNATRFESTPSGAIQDSGQTSQSRRDGRSFSIDWQPEEIDVTESMPGSSVRGI